jgi:hypothetical protein
MTIEGPLERFDLKQHLPLNFNSEGKVKGYGVTS